MSIYGGKYEIGQVVEFVVTQVYQGTHVISGKSTDRHQMQNMSLVPKKGEEGKYVVGDKVKAQVANWWGGRFLSWVILGKSE